MDYYTESVTRLLTHDVLLGIFESLPLCDLLNVEQVCPRWENVVRIYFAMHKTLDMTSVSKSDALTLRRRCGPSLRRLVVSGKIEVHGKDANLIKDIAEECPNLESIDLHGLKLDDDDFDVLSTKCNRLKSIKILGLLLANLPGLSSLTVINAQYGKFENCFTKLGPNLEHLDIRHNTFVTKSGYSHILSRCRNLKTVYLGSSFDCDVNVFYSFCQGNAALRSMTVAVSQVPKETFGLISNCSMLEELRLYMMRDVDCDVLIKISEGCSNLRRLELDGVYFARDRGLKSFARCKQLTNVAIHNCHPVITDDSLLALANVRILKKLVISNCCRITDVSCRAVLAKCPQLEELNTSGTWKCRVTNATVDAAIKAVKSRNNGIALHLIMDETSVDRPRAAIDHPLLKVTTKPKERRKCH